MEIHRKVNVLAWNMSGIWLVSPLHRNKTKPVVIGSLSKNIGQFKIVSINHRVKSMLIYHKFGQLSKDHNNPNFWTSARKPIVLLICKPTIAQSLKYYTPKFEVLYQPYVLFSHRYSSTVLYYPYVLFVRKTRILTQ